MIKIINKNNIFQMDKNNEKTKLLEIQTKDNYIKNKKIRNHEIDFIRILAMFGIVFKTFLTFFQNIYYYFKAIISHIFTKKKIYFKYNKFKELKFLNILVSWHNNGYSFISGFVGYKTNKYSNLFYLWIWVFFIQ